MASRGRSYGVARVLGATPSLSGGITYTPKEAARLEGAFCAWGGLIRIGTPDPVRLWTGIGDLPVTRSAFDADGSVFQGGGRIVSIPAFQMLWNGLAERMTVSLIGVTDDMTDLVYEEAEDVKGSSFRMGLVVFDDDWQQIGPVRWLRRGRCDVLETDNQPGGYSRVKTISLSVGSQLTGRAVPGAGTYTNADQQSRPGSEDDRICERTSSMTQNVTILWPK